MLGIQPENQIQSSLTPFLYTNVVKKLVYEKNLTLKDTCSAQKLLFNKNAEN